MFTNPRSSAARLSVLVAAVSLVAAACGGDDDSSDDADEPAPATSAASDEDVATTDAPTTETPATEAPAEEPADDYEPGDIEYRVVNLLDTPADVYVRSNGLVEAWLVEEGLPPGAVSDLYAPPADGKVVITQPGAGDATCVVDCDHFIAEASAFEGTGDVHTVVLHDADGEPGALDLWEEPTTATGNSNSMPAADPSTGVVIVTAIDVSDADFGMQTSIDGIDGCIEPIGGGNVLVGGNQTPSFAYDGAAADFVFYNNQDRECLDDVYGGPFAVSGGPGTRTHILLTGAPYELDAIVLPFVNSETGDSAGVDADAADSPNYDAAIAFMEAEMQTELGMSPDEAACVAPYLVDAIGADTLIVDGEQVVLEELGDEAAEQAAIGLFDGAVACGIDPDSL